ncbi:hypothetical protein ACFQT0_22720 [Hymenobacter humi]|uniref:DUF192 domain-containing protein n=1 Tax=Hymenobacter humi TaxID=1411620 RepID=A0ABW2UBP6_9BACT
MLHAGRVALPAGGSTLTLTLNLLHGPIRVDVLPAAAGQPPLIWMTQRRPVFGAVHAPEVVLPLFGLTPDDLLPGAPIQTVSTGTPHHGAAARPRRPAPGPCGRCRGPGPLPRRKRLF